MVGDLFLTRASRYLSPGGVGEGVVGGFLNNGHQVIICRQRGEVGEGWGRRILIRVVVNNWSLW